jgi:oligoendopeptidase F
MESIESTSRWSLKDLLSEPVENEVEQYLSNLEKAVSSLEKCRSDLTSEITEESFNKILMLVEEITKMMRRLQAYSYLWLSEDTQNKAALNMRDRLDQSLVNLGNRIIFFEIWFKDLPDKTAERLISKTGDLKYFLESIRRFKPYTLSENEEKLLSIKDPNGIDALVSLYELITNRFVFSLFVEGEERKITRDQLTSYYYNESADIREAAYKELYRVYMENSTVLAQIYSHRARDWHAEGIELRGYSSAISARNLGNDIPDEVVDSLLSVCRKNTGIFHRYFQFKADHLGIGKLRRYDIYAPLASSNKRYDFSYARQFVLATFQEFSPMLANLSKQVFEQQHLDSEIRQGKRGGGFCYAALPEFTPWVMVNYNGLPGDIATLAHELGHAVHAMLAKNHSVLSFHPSQPLAETASIFAEMLLTDRLLKEEQDPAVRRDLLVRVIDDAYATIIRQAYFTIFERDAHQMLVDGRSFDELANHYSTILSEQFGDAVELTPEYKWEWITIPHIYDSPFYTYSYSFGQLLVLALYEQFRRKGSSFIPEYLKILSYGGSESPVKVLIEAGLDITKPSFWQGGFDVLEKMISDLIQIT